MAYLIEGRNESKRLDLQSKISAYNIDDELEFFNYHASDYILDAGCGHGNLIEKLLKKGVEKIDGIDFGSDRIKEARERFKNYSNVRPMVGDLSSLKVVDGTYDKVICRYLFEHLESPATILHELYRVSKVGGEIQIINFDDIFFGLYSKDSKLNSDLERVKTLLPYDFEIGRKLPVLLREIGFVDVEWHAETFYFKNEDRRMEKENSRMRLIQARDSLSKLFKTALAYDEFCTSYLDALDDPCTVLWTNKFLIHGVKPDRRVVDIFNKEQYAALNLEA